MNMLIDMIDMNTLSQLAREGFDDWGSLGDVWVKERGDLLLFNYSHAAQYAGRWNWFERVSRGLILNAKTGEVVARPFDRFFNWGEGDRKSDGRIVTITEKLDGSLGVHYRDPDPLCWLMRHRIASRGSFDGEHAEWATLHLHNFYDLCDLPDNLTLLFEIIYPDNRIVVDYGDAEELYLLAARNRFTGEYLPFYPDLCNLAERYGFPLPKTYQFDSVADVLEVAAQLEATAEGWVIEFSDGQRFKAKGDQYVKVHRLVTNATFKRVLAMVAGGTFDTVVAHVPDEFLAPVTAWRDEIETRANDIERQAGQAFASAPKGSRKEFALWTRENHACLSMYLFLMLDGHHEAIRPAIYKREFAT